MTTPGRLERNGPIAVYAVGAVIILFIAIAAAWMITRDYRIAIEQAELHLENVSVVLAEHTRFALQMAPPDIHARVSGRSASSGSPERDQELVNNYFDRFYSSIELAYTGRIILFRRTAHWSRVTRVSTVLMAAVMRTTFCSSTPGIPAMACCGAEACSNPTSVWSPIV